VSGERALLLSIRPQYAEAIMSGAKSVELRRTRPDLAAGALVFLYASAPVKCLIGAATLGGVLHETPRRLWATVGAASGISRRDYNDYFRGSPRAFGLILLDATRLSNPITLRDVRRRIRVEPPQSWRYIEANVIRRVTGAAGR
jgi:predicted transcriptional regulator